MFVALEKLINLHDGYLRAFSVGGRELLLVQTDNEPRLIENRCPHQGWPMSGGALRGNSIQCPVHGFSFDLTSGAVVSDRPVACGALEFVTPDYEGASIGLWVD